jgi:pimeloyl-ACP methyl ester carboxylesterase
MVVRGWRRGARSQSRGKWTRGLAAHIGLQGLKAPINLAYKVHGPDHAPHKLLFIHGLGTAGHYSDTFIALLLQSAVGGGLQVVTMDNRGSGESCTPPGRYTTPSLARDWMALAAHLGWERPHVMGASMGGMIAQECVGLHTRHTKAHHGTPTRQHAIDSFAREARAASGKPF